MKMAELWASVVLAASTMLWIVGGDGLFFIAPTAFVSVMSLAATLIATSVFDPLPQTPHSISMSASLFLLLYGMEKNCY